MILKIKRLENGKDLELPKYMTENSVGMDLRAAVDEEYILKAGEVGLIPTGFAIELEHGYEAQVRPRSGLAAKHGIGILNSPGTIDSDYRGEVKIILFNFSKEDFTIKRGMRIAQMIIAKVTAAEVVEVEDISKTERDAGGFGHTGVH